MPGPLRARALARPSFLDALAVAGSSAQTLVAEDEGQIVAAATRALLPLRDGDTVLPAGRLSHLHIAEAHRGQLLARGFAELRRLHADGAAACYLTTVMAKNHSALAALAAPRAGLPVYADQGPVLTRILVPRQSPIHQATGITIRPAGASDLTVVLDLLARTASRRSAVPAYSEAEVRDGVGLLRGFGIGRLQLAWRDGRAVGCLGLWDQRAFRQQQVVGYAPWLAALRPAWNLLATPLGRPALPASGVEPAYAFAALPLIDDDDPVVFAALLAAVRAQARGLDGVVVALHAADPLQTVLAHLPGWTLQSRLFVAHWPDGAAAAGRIAARVPYIEAGAL